MNKTLFFSNTDWNIHLERAALTLSAAITLFTLGWVLWRSHYGLDFTDESYYLVAMSSPWNYSATATQFSFVYHPLYVLLDGNIAALRQANILITFGLAWILCLTVLRTSFAKPIFTGLVTHDISDFITSGALAVSALSALVFAGLWLATPCYDSLNFQSLLIAGTGLLLAEKRISKASLMGWVLIGIGGWASFMAKPTTAALLGLGTVIYLSFAGKLNPRLLIIALFTAIALLITSAWLIDGSIFAFVERLRNGAEIISHTSGHTPNQMLRLGELNLGSKEIIFIVVETFLLSAAIVSLKPCNKYANILGFTISLAIAFVIFVVASGVFIPRLEFGSDQGALFFAIPFSAFITGLFLTRARIFLQLKRPCWAIVLFLLVLPYVYAFGTSNNYWFEEYCACIFWLLAGLIFISPVIVAREHKRILIPICLTVQLITITTLSVGMQNPYRGSLPLSQDRFPIAVGRPESRLILPKEYGEYISNAVKLANQAGFQPGTPMIDMTGQFPGTLYALRAKSIGQAWMIGGYPDSDRRAIATLSLVSCDELAKAWLLIEPHGPEKLSPKLLENFGINMTTDFKKIGTLITPSGAGGYNQRYMQQILKPIRSFGSARSACKSAFSASIRQRSATLIMSERH